MLPLALRSLGGARAAVSSLGTKAGLLKAAHSGTSKALEIFGGDRIPILKSANDSLGKISRNADSKESGTVEKKKRKSKEEAETPAPKKQKPPTEKQTAAERKKEALAASRAEVAATAEAGRVRRRKAQDEKIEQVRATNKEANAKALDAAGLTDSDKQTAILGEIREDIADIKENTKNGIAGGPGGSGASGGVGGIGGVGAAISTFLGLKAVDALKSLAPKMLKLAGGFLRVMGPVGLAVGAATAGYQAGKWLNEKFVEPNAEKISKAATNASENIKAAVDNPVAAAKNALGIKRTGLAKLNAEDSIELAQSETLKKRIEESQTLSEFIDKVSTKARGGKAEVMDIFNALKTDTMSESEIKTRVEDEVDRRKKHPPKVDKYTGNDKKSTTIEETLIRIEQDKKINDERVALAQADLKAGIDPNARYRETGNVTNTGDTTINAGDKTSTNIANAADTTVNGGATTSANLTNAGDTAVNGGVVNNGDKTSSDSVNTVNGGTVTNITPGAATTNNTSTQNLTAADKLTPMADVVSVPNVLAEMTKEDKKAEAASAAPIIVQAPAPAGQRQETTGGNAATGGAQGPTVTRTPETAIQRLTDVMFGYGMP